MIDTEFFSRYKPSKGIRNITMNNPLIGGRIPLERVGVEIEVEGRNLPVDVRGAWECVNDGSLRNGYEYRFVFPQRPEDVSGALDSLFDYFRKAETVLENSNRCSTHVHISVQGRKINEITSSIVLWCTFEEILIKYCGEERQKNHFALSSSDANGLISAWRGFLQTGRAAFPNGLKYSALNILPIYDKGSIEIRVGAAADDYEGVNKWVTLCYALTDYAMERFKNPQDLSAVLSERGGLEVLTNAVQGYDDLEGIVEELVELMGGAQEFEMACLRGFRNVQELVNGFPWYDWMEEINKPFIPRPFGDYNEANARNFREMVNMVEINGRRIPVPAHLLGED